MNFSTLPPALRIVTGGLAIACAGMGCTTAAGAAFDNATIPLATWSATSGTWDTSGGTDLRSVVSQARILPGSGLQEVIVAGAKTLSVDPAVVPFYFSATATIDFALLAAGACANQTFPVTGAASGDAVAVGWPASLEAGLLGAVFVSAANTVTVRLCNLSGAPLDPASHTFRATIVRAL